MKKKRATVICENPKGQILLVKMPKNYWMLPGGYPETSEMRMAAAIRELRLETGLLAAEVKTLFEYESEHRMHKVFWVKADGTPRAMPSKFFQVAYFDEVPTEKISKSTQEIVRLYREQ